MKRQIYDVVFLTLKEFVLALLLVQDFQKKHYATRAKQVNQLETLNGQDSTFSNPDRAAALGNKRYSTANDQATYDNNYSISKKELSYSSSRQEERLSAIN